MPKLMILFLTFSLSLYANGKPTFIDKEIMELSLNYKFDEADRLLKELFNKSDELKNHFLYLNTELIKAIHSAEIAPFKDKRSVRDSVNLKLIDYCEKIIERYENKDLSLYDQYYLGSIYGLLGRFYGVKRSWFSAFSNGKEGKNILEGVIEKDPNFIDAYLLLGMMNYYADRLGGVTEFIAGILGLSGDRKLGLEYLNKVEKEGYLTNWQATMILSEIYARLENNDFDALPYLKKFNKSFPNNTHFANWYCNELIDLFNLKEAGKIISSIDSKKVTDIVKAKYYHLSGDYKKSNEIYDTLLSDNEMTYRWMYEDGKFKQAVNFLMLGDIKNAQKISSQLNDSYSSIINQMFMHQALTKRMINFRKNLLLDKEEAIVLINHEPDFGNLVYLEGFYNYYLGVYYFQRNKFSVAEKYFSEAKELDFDAFGNQCIKYLINIYKTTNVNRESVEKLLDEIDDIDNDGFEFSAQDLEEKYKL